MQRNGDNIRSFMSVGIILIISLCIILFGCYRNVKKPAAPKMFFYIAIDNSASYSLSKDGTKIDPRVGNTEAFELAKDRFYNLLSSGIFMPDDEIIGISEFTDQPKEEIHNKLPGILIGSTGWNSISETIRTILDEIKTRPLSRNEPDYKTYYRNVLDKAFETFQSSGSKKEQWICILLTDIRGSEVEKFVEVKPENYPKCYVIKLEAELKKISGITTSEIIVTPNQKLFSISPSANAVHEYVYNARNYFVRNVPDIKRELNIINTILLIAIFLIFIYLMIWLWLFRPKGRSLFLRKIIGFPSIKVEYHINRKQIVVNGKNCNLPSDHKKYKLRGVDREITNCMATSLNEVYLSTNQPLPAGIDLEIEVPVFVKDPKTQGLKETYCRGSFRAEAPPLEPSYNIAIRKASEFSNVHTFILSESYVNLSEELRIKTIFEAKKDAYYVTIRTRGGKVLKEDGDELIGSIRYVLDDAISIPIMLTLPDEDYETIEINVLVS